MNLSDLIIVISTAIVITVTYIFGVKKDIRENTEALKKREQRVGEIEIVEHARATELSELHTPSANG